MSNSPSREAFMGDIALILEVGKDDLLHTNFEALEAFDSLALIRIAIKIEDIFGLSVSSEELLSLNNVEEMLDFIESKQN